MYTQTGPRRPTVFLGVLLGLLFIVFMLLIRNCVAPPQSSLREQFVPGPTDLARPAGIPIPDTLHSAVGTTQALLQGGEEVPAITPNAQSGPLEVIVSTLTPVEGGLRVTGRIHNVGEQPITVPLNSFRFRDDQGRIYAAQGEAKAMLAPGQSETFDLTLPTPNPRELVLLISQPAAGIDLEMILLVGGATPTP